MIVGYCLNCGDSREEHDIDLDTGEQFCTACYDCEEYNDDLED